MITPLCSYPPDCPYAGGPGMCHFADNRTPEELYDLWRGCFGAAVADQLMDEWIAYVERAIRTCEIAERQSTGSGAWDQRAARFRQRLHALQAVRTTTEETEL